MKDGSLRAAMLLMCFCVLTLGGIGCAAAETTETAVALPQYVLPSGQLIQGTGYYQGDVKVREELTIQGDLSALYNEGDQAAFLGKVRDYCQLNGMDFMIARLESGIPGPYNVAEKEIIATAEDAQNSADAKGNFDYPIEWHQADGYFISARWIAGSPIVCIGMINEQPFADSDQARQAVLLAAADYAARHINSNIGPSTGFDNWAYDKTLETMAKHLGEKKQAEANAPLAADSGVFSSGQTKAEIDEDIMAYYTMPW